MVHGLDRGCPAIPRHPYERYQVCYREGTRQRSAGIFPTKRRAKAERRAIERGRTELTGATDVDLEQMARTLLGEYIATSGGQPGRTSTHLRVRHRKKVEKRILPAFGNIPLGDLDASTIGAWKSAHRSMTSDKVEDGRFGRPYGSGAHSRQFEKTNLRLRRPFIPFTGTQVLT